VQGDDTAGVALVGVRETLFRVTSAAIAITTFIEDEITIAIKS
jgi:hypothetical protein